MHTFIFNTTLLTLCHFDIFLPSKGHLQAVQLDIFQQQDQQNELPDVKFTLASSVYLVNQFVDLAVEMYLSYSLKRALSGLKHVRLSVNKLVLIISTCISRFFNVKQWY